MNVVVKIGWSGRQNDVIWNIKMFYINTQPPHWLIITGNVRPDTAAVILSLNASTCNG